MTALQCDGHVREGLQPRDGGRGWGVGGVWGVGGEGLGGREGCEVECERGS